MFHETIIALSSPPVRGGMRAIVRASGPHAWQLAAAVAGFPQRPGHHPDILIQFAPDAAVVGSLLLFRGPKSYTGEDIAEFHLPNSPPLIRALIDRLLTLAAERQLPARTAEPGEFSARAFFNGKVDLTEAEGIAATISATQSTQLRAAAGLRQGTLHRDIAQLSERVAGLLALVEAGIDFADEEDIRFIDRETLSREIAAISLDILERLSDSLHIDQFGNPPTVVLIGKPNAGKSSLINALTGTDRSIVSPVAGTTRDILAATLRTPHGEIRLVDLPGEELPTDELRQKMMEARETAMLDADLVVEVVDATRDAGEVGGAAYPGPFLRVLNKIDLLPITPSDALAVSAKTAFGISALRDKIIALVTRREHAGGQRLSLNHRHRALLLDTQQALQRAGDLADTAARHPELLAAELREALDHLGRITGTISPDDVLGKIFSQFCLGK